MHTHTRASRLLFGAILFAMISTANGGNADKLLAPCPDSPNCVSTLATDRRHSIEPFHYHTSAATAWEHLTRAVLAEPRMTPVRDDGGYLHAEARSRIFRFVDDVEFILAPDEQLIHGRSAARTGHSDFGVNRRRMERIRTHFRQLQQAE